MPAPAIEFQSVTFARALTHPVLDGLTLSVESGEVVAMVGRSGAGKTTLLRLVNRLLLPGSGTVLVEGRRIYSCLTLAVMHAGERIETIEGLAQGYEDADWSVLGAVAARAAGLQPS